MSLCTAAIHPSCIPSAISSPTSAAQEQAIKTQGWAEEYFSNTLGGITYGCAIGCATFAATLLIFELVGPLAAIIDTIDWGCSFAIAGVVDCLWGLPRPESVQNALKNFLSEETAQTLLESDPTSAEWLAKFFLFEKSNWNTNFFAPLKEEFIYRVLLQGVLKKCCQGLFSSETYKICGIDLPLSTWISILVTSVIFGMAHTHGGLQLMLAAAVCGSVYGIAKEKFGFMAGWAAHSIDNTLCTLF